MKPRARTLPGLQPAERGRPTGRRWGHRGDVFLIALQVCLLVPAVLVNAILWRERLLGIALYVPSLGGDPGWRARPLLLPLVVAAAATSRLMLARRRWPASRRLTRAYAIVLGVALVVVAAALIPEPLVFSR